MYVEFHNRLMEASGQLNEEMVFDLAEEAGLDVDRMREEMDTPEITNILRRNSKLASALRITGTPAFVIGDVLVPGAVELTDLRALVEEAREGN